MSTVTAPKLNYESFLPNSRGVAYVCPNEDVGIWRELVKGKRIKRAAGICSGGEVGFFALLPTIREELVLIDHNLGSLYFAVAKYLLLRKHGYAGLLRLFRDPPKFKKALEIIRDEIPKNLRDVQDDLYYRGHIEDRLLKAVQNTNTYSGGNGTTLGEHWQRPNTYQQRQLSAKLDKVKFVHGDFDALDKQGKFDLLYMSNAHESGNGNAGNKDLQRISKCLNPGAYILSSTEIRPWGNPTRVLWDNRSLTYVEQPNPRYRPAPEGWELVKKVPRRGVGMTRWNYCLYRVEGATA